MDALEGLWRLVEGRAWDAQGNDLPPPYGSIPFGQIMFRGGRMLAALCNGDAQPAPGQDRGFSSYGGTYTFDGQMLVTKVDMASDPQRIGGEQRRGVRIIDRDTIVLLPPPREYAGGSVQRRELVWQRVWRPDGALIPLDSD
jgi:Lipocalin-like domain